MKTLIFSFFSSLLVLLIIDIIWLNIMAKRFYAHRLGSIITKIPNFLPAGFFYIIYAIGLSIFVVLPAFNGYYSLTKVFFLGSLFGLVAYATYDLSNQATLKKWPLVVTLVDLVWGSFLTGLVSVITTYLVKYFS